MCRHYACCTVAPRPRTPASRRVLVRAKDESGAALWERVEAAADALGELHAPNGVSVGVQDYHGSLEQFERGYNSTAKHNHRLALHWLMASDKPGDVRLWAATKLAHMIGLLPRERVK